MIKKIINIICCAMLCITCASAHPGHTDAAGGHWDNSTGEYHYHHGYPAHQHENGVCPYEQPEAQELETDDEYEYDYGPEAETDFDSKREAWANGYASAIEYSSDSTYSSSAYSQGYDEGYDEGYEQGLAEGRESGSDEGRQDGYDEGYRDGYAASDSAPDNDIIDRSEIHTSGESQPINGKIETKKKFTLPEWKIGETDAVVFPFVCLIAGISIFAFIVAVIKGK